MIIQKVCAVLCPFTNRLMQSKACQQCIYMEDYNEQSVICMIDPNRVLIHHDKIK